LELYIRKLIYFDLAKSKAERVLRQLRKLNWHDADTLSLIRKPFFKPWKARYSTLHLLAFLASELSLYYPSFGVSIVDNCLEEIRLGLETNIFKFNQRRISTVKFLGELYNYRLIESDTIFDTLYFILRFGHGKLFIAGGSHSHI
jgi:regulator of nonsense transcripts 2